LSSVTGTFFPAELVRRASDDQTRATNVVTNTQFALFPSFNSYIDGLQIFTNTVGPGDYPGRIVDIVLSNIVTGSTYYVYKTSDLSLLASGTAAASTVTITNIAYVADFGITVRVRKASSATKYIPFETQATVRSTGVDVFIGQTEDSIVGASVNGTIAGDFTINTTTKTIKHTADSVVYTVNELYTWLMDYFDDVTTIDDTVPISAQTPTEYTLINGWFMDNLSFKYLSGGAIQTDGQDAYSTHVLTVTGGTYADPVSGDITKTVMAGATAIGPLLDYEVISVGVSSKWYVRDTRTVPAVIANTTAMTITTGTGSGNNSANSLSGESIWSNIFSLGTIVSGTTLDLYQNDSQITPWWSAGQIDILVKVKEAGTEIDSGNLTVLARKYSTLYDHYVVDASTGRNPVPLAAFADTNNEVIEATVGAYTGFTFDFGAASKDLGNGNGSQPYDCVIDCDDHSIQEVYEYLKYVTRTGSSTTLNGVNGEYYQAVGDIRLSYSGEASGPFVEGNAITSSAGGTGYIVSLIDSGATGTLLIRNVHGTFANANTLTSSGTTATISSVPDTILQSKQAPFGVFSGYMSPIDSYTSLENLLAECRDRSFRLERTTIESFMDRYNYFDFSGYHKRYFVHADMVPLLVKNVIEDDEMSKDPAFLADFTKFLTIIPLGFNEDHVKSGWEEEDYVRANGIGKILDLMSEQPWPFEEALQYIAESNSVPQYISEKAKKLLEDMNLSSSTTDEEIDYDWDSGRPSIHTPKRYGKPKVVTRTSIKKLDSVDSISTSDDSNELSSMGKFVSPSTTHIKPTSLLELS
jgi:hypothetical protein